MTDQNEAERQEQLRARERQYEIDRITYQYATEYRSGRSPRIEAYIQRYPEYAPELLEYALYFHTIGVEEEIDDEPQIALDITSLVEQGIALDIAPPKLAESVGLSDELLARLDERIIAAATVPRTLLQRLASALKTAPEAIAAYLASAVAGQSPGFYYAEKPPEQQQQSFLDAVQHDDSLSPERKREWAEIVHTDIGDAQESDPGR